MRIVIYSHTGTYYGAPQAILEVATELLQEHDVHFIVPCKGKLSEALEQHNIDYSVSRVSDWLYKDREADYSQFNFFKHRVKLSIQYFIDRHRINKTHVTLLKEIKPDLVIVNSSASPTGLIAARKSSIPSILWIRESIMNKKGVNVRCLVPKKWVKRKFMFAQEIIVPSEFLRKYYLDSFGINQIRVINDSVNTHYLKDWSSKIDHENLNIGLVGSISERKGQLDFMKYFSDNSFPGSIKIFGDGPQTLINKLKSFEEKGKCELFGFIDEPNDIYSQFDIYINLGRDESFGRTTIEAMVCGKLVFGLNSGATAELIENGVNGFLINSYDEIFNILAELDDVIISKIQKNARDFGLQFNPQRTFEALSELINQLPSFK